MTKATGMVMGLAATAVALAGCAIDANYPPRGENDAAINDPNVHPTPRLVALSMARVTARRDPALGEYVVNLPRGMEKRWAELVLHQAGDANARLVSEDTRHLPTYHITRVWVRPGAWGEVEILRPLMGVAGPMGGEAYEPSTVRLRKSGPMPWKVESVRVWPVREVTPPSLFGWGNDARADPVANLADGAEGE